jgi:hypothetical protein
MMSPETPHTPEKYGAKLTEEDDTLRDKLIESMFDDARKTQEEKPTQEAASTQKSRSREKTREYDPMTDEEVEKLLKSVNLDDEPAGGEPVQEDNSSSKNLTPDNVLSVWNSLRPEIQQIILKIDAKTLFEKLNKIRERHSQDTHPQVHTKYHLLRALKILIDNNDELASKISKNLKDYEGRAAA